VSAADASHLEVNLMEDIRVQVRPGSLYTCDHRATHYVMRAVPVDESQWLVALESGYHGERGTWAILRQDEPIVWEYFMELFDLKHEGDREGYTALLAEIGIEIEW
jgi:hypothetical protein